MDRRLSFHQVLKTCTPVVYFEPPEDAKMVYPCIRYERDAGSTKHANNRPYNYVQQYQVTLIARDADTDILAKLAALPQSTHDRFFVADNLNHDVFSIYF